MHLPDPRPSGPNIFSGPQTPRSRYFLRFHNFIEFISWFLRSCLWKLGLGGYELLAWYVWSGPKWVKCSFEAPDLKVNFFWDSWFYWIHLMILEKMRSCLYRLGLGFWTSGLIPLGPSGPNVVFRPQTPRSRSFLKFHDFIWFISWFLR